MDTLATKPKSFISHKYTHQEAEELIVLISDK